MLFCGPGIQRWLISVVLTHGLREDEKGPQRCPHPNPQNIWICVALDGKGNLADVTKLKILRWILWVFWVAPNCNHKGPYRREVRGVHGEESSDVMMKSLIGGTQPGAQKCWPPPEAEGYKEWVLPWGLQKEPVSFHLDFNPKRLILDFWPYG